MTWQVGVAVAALLGAAVWSWRDDRRVALVLGFLLPVDYVAGVPAGVFDVARYLAVAVLVVLAPVTIREDRRRKVLLLAGAIATVGLVRLGFALPRADRNSIVWAGVMLLSTSSAALLALRSGVHRALVTGYVSGLAISAATSVMQALDLPVLRAGNQEGHRYPGLATFTMLLTWQLAFGIMIAVYLVVTRRRGTRLWWTGALLLPLFLAALVTNGAQGGLLGLLAGGGALVYARPPGLWRALRRSAVWVLVLAAALAAVMILAGVDVPTIDGIRGEGGYRNERARWDVAINGLREIRRHPLTGVGRTRFMDRYTIAPHFLPVDSGVVAGVLGLVVASALLGYVVLLVLRGPADRRPVTVLGFTVLAAMAADTLIESNGPFTGLSRVMVLFVAYVTSLGEHDDGPDLHDGTERAATEDHEAIVRVDAGSPATSSEGRSAHP